MDYDIFSRSRFAQGRYFSKEAQPYLSVFLNEKIGWAGSTQGSVLKTINGGKTWELLGRAA